DYVYIAEQNHDFTHWKADYARKAPIVLRNGAYFIDDVDPIYGWMEIENNDQLESFDESNIDLILDKYRNPPPQGIFEYLFTSDRRKGSTSSSNKSCS
ncbi:unnamed protein product, partial [Rotaria magnacalcarata]